MKVQRMMASGYFPRELPPSFTSTDFAAAVPSLTASIPRALKTRPAQVNLARPGTLRRRLSVPNPFSQLLLVRECAAAWPTLDAHLQKSSISLSRPLLNARNDGRALVFKSPFGDRPLERLARMNRARFTLTADISACYGSIYTHSIEWALHTKAAAKAHLSVKGAPKLLGGKIDTAVRNAQDGQTKGIPLGPDTSLLVAEIIMSAIDVQLEARHPQASASAIRLVDDLEYFAQSRGEAEDVLLAWDSLLHSYDLSLNPAKTSIVEGLVPHEAAWRVDLSQFRLRTTSDTVMANDIRSFFSRAFELSAIHPDDPVLTYALNSVRPRPSTPKAWRAFQHAIFAAATAEPSCLRHVSFILKEAVVGGLSIDRNLAADTLNGMCYYHALLEHGSEVAWSLHIMRTLGLSLTEDAAKRVSGMLDNSCQLLLLEFIARGAVSGIVPNMTAVIARAEDPLAPMSEDWLLGYEAARNGWANPVEFRAQSMWQELLSRNVAFFHAVAPAAPAPAAPAPAAPAPAAPAPAAPAPAAPAPAAPAPGWRFGLQISPIIEAHEDQPESGY